jgi:hypothetical protein
VCLPVDLASKSLCFWGRAAGVGSSGAQQEAPTGVCLGSVRMRMASQGLGLAWELIALDQAARGCVCEMDPSSMSLLVFPSGRGAIDSRAQQGRCGQSVSAGLHQTSSVDSKQGESRPLPWHHLLYFRLLSTLTQPYNLFDSALLHFIVTAFAPLSNHILAWETETCHSDPVLEQIPPPCALPAE